MSAPSDDGCPSLADFQAACATFEALSAQEPPEKEPYKFKYEARKLMVRGEKGGRRRHEKCCGSCFCFFPPSVCFRHGSHRTCDGRQESWRDKVAALLDGGGEHAASAKSVLDLMLIGSKRRIGVNYILTEENQGGCCLSLRCGCVCVSCVFCALYAPPPNAPFNPPHQLDTICLWMSPMR